MHTRDNLLKQMPGLKKKFTRYAPYSKATIQQVIEPLKLKNATQMTTKTLEHQWFSNEGNGQFNAKVLPYLTQAAPCQAIIVQDFNGDGKTDILMLGNDHGSDVETGKMDASNGYLLLGQANGQFILADNDKIGLWANKDVRNCLVLPQSNGETMLLVGNNNDKLGAFAF